MAIRDYNPYGLGFQGTLNDWKGVFGQSFATTSSLMIGDAVPRIKPKRKEETMTLFKIYLVDRKNGHVLSEHTAVGKDEGDAAVGLNLTEEELKLKEKRLLSIIYQPVGEFDLVKVNRTIIEKEE
jgi:hypothetical protein